MYTLKFKVKPDGMVPLDSDEWEAKFENCEELGHWHRPMCNILEKGDPGKH
jgi:hypothetical protein